MTDRKIQQWTNFIREYPEASWAGAIFGVISFLAINFAWWLIELPDLINGHSDSLLVAAFTGSFGLVLFDTVTAVWTVRRAHRISIAMKIRGNNDDET